MHSTSRITKAIVRYITDAERKEHDAHIAEMRLCIAGAERYLVLPARRATDLVLV